MSAETAALEVQVCPFTSGDPEVVQGAHNVAVVDGGVDRGHFLAVVEVHGPPQGRDTVAEDLTAILESVYLEAPGGVTAALRAALQAANGHLLELNRERPAKARFLSGASCLVLGDGEAYIAQAGPALAYVRSREKVQRFPSHSSWLESPWPDELDELYLSPLGLHEGVPVDLFHYRTDLDDRVLLVTSALARLASPEDIEQALGAPSAGSLAQRACHLAEGAEISGLALRLTPPDQEEAPLELDRPAAAHPESTGSGAAEHGRTLEAGTPPTDLAPPQASQPGGNPAEEEAMSTLPDDYTGLYPDHERPEEGARRFRRGARQERLSGLGTLLARLAELLRGLLGLLLGALASLAVTAGRGLGRLLPLLGVWARETLRVWLPRLLPGDEERPLGRRSPADLASHRRYLWLALAVPILLILLVVTSRAQYNRSRQAQFEQHMVLAQEKITSAATLSEPAAVRDLLERAEDDVARALALRPQSEEARTLHGKLLARLDDLNHVVRVSPAELVTLRDGPPQPARLIVRGIDLYVLDRGSQRVYKYLLNESGTDLGPPVDNPVLMRKGDERENIVVQDLVDLVWLGPGGERGRDNLAVLDRAGHLLEYDPARGIFLAPLAGTDGWRKPLLTAGHQGHLYVLDPSLNQILKYEPRADGYPLPPIFYLSPEADVDLAGALDLAVDGDVWVLLSTGEILRFREGLPLEFKLSQLPHPLQEPVALYAGGTSQSLYVADAGLGAVLQFGKDGRFVRQLRPPYDGLSLQGLRTFHLDEARSRLYLAVEGTVYGAAIPPPQPAARAAEEDPGS